MKPKKRILIIEDMPSVRAEIVRCIQPRQRLAVQLLECHGCKEEAPFEIFEAGQGDEGVRIAQEAHTSGNGFDIILMDMNMPPGIDGSETLKRIREFDKSAHVVFCMAYCTHTQDELAEANGGVPPPVVLKPFNCKMLLQAIFE